MPSFDIAQHIFRSPELKSVVEDAVSFFSQTPVHPLPPSPGFVGAGVYALYYRGPFELYAPVSAMNREAYEQPIYVGKAVPEGWRTARVKVSQGRHIYRRLKEHSRTIEQTENIELAHFRCRFMILDGIEGDHVVPVEAELIRRYTPLWNSQIEGFGLHDPGAKRYGQLLSEWDTLHPGRPWTKRWTGERPLLDEIIQKIRRLFE